MVIVGSLFERRAAGLYHNTAVVLDADGALVGIYRKMHIPDDPLYYEKFYFTPGDLGFRSFATAHAQVGTLVCWDQWFPEAARLTALPGRRSSSIPPPSAGTPTRRPSSARRSTTPGRPSSAAHAIANGVFVAVPSTASATKARLEFWGGSFVADPFGRIIAKASHDREEILLARCDLGAVAETRRHWPFLRDRRIDAYEGLLHRYLDRKP